MNGSVLNYLVCILCIVEKIAQNSNIWNESHIFSFKLQLYVRSLAYYSKALVIGFWVTFWFMDNTSVS